MNVDELIAELLTMPSDLPVRFFVNDKRVDIIEVRNVGDCVDLYEEVDND